MVQVQPALGMLSEGFQTDHEHDRSGSLKPVYFDDLIYDTCGELNKCTSTVLSSTLSDFWHLLSENENYSIVEWMVDTGCSTMLAQSSLVNRWLHQAQKSHMVMNGFSTTSTEEADLTGNLHAYVLNVVSSSPGAITRKHDSSRTMKGVSIDIQGVHTAEIARHNLMGLSYFCNELGFRPNEGFTGLHKIDESTGESIDIPFFHNPATGSWHMATIIADSLDAAQAAGEDIERVFTNLTTDMIRQALAFDRHTTKILQVCGGLMHMHLSGDQYMINLDYINKCTGFDRMDESTYLSPEDFKGWVESMMNVSSHICASSTFDEIVSSVPISPPDYEYDPFAISDASIFPVWLSEALGLTYDHVPEDDDSSMGGIKKFTKNGDKTSSLKFHTMKGHPAYHPDCEVCKFLRLHHNRTFKHIDRYIDPRPCFVFNMDIMTASDRSSRGNKYAVLMRCPSTGFFEVIYLNFKHEFVSHVH